MSINVKFDWFRSVGGGVRVGGIFFLIVGVVIVIRIGGRDVRGIGDMGSSRVIDLFGL